MSVRRKIFANLWCLRVIADVKTVKKGLPLEGDPFEYLVKLDPMPGATDPQLKMAESNLIAKWGLRKRGGLLTNTNTRELEEEIWGKAWS